MMTKVVSRSVSSTLTTWRGAPDAFERLRLEAGTSNGDGLLCLRAGPTLVEPMSGAICVCWDEGELGSKELAVDREADSTWNDSCVVLYSSSFSGSRWKTAFPGPAGDLGEWSRDLAGGDLGTVGEKERLLGGAGADGGGGVPGVEDGCCWFIANRYFFATR